MWLRNKPKVLVAREHKWCREEVRNVGECTKVMGNKTTTKGECELQILTVGLELQVRNTDHRWEMMNAGPGG